MIGKGIGRIYKYDQQNWPYPPPNTTVLIPQRSDNFKETQLNSPSNAAVGAHNLA